MATVNEHRIRHEIQVYREGGCCEDHKEAGWYPSKMFRGILSDPNTSQDYAYTLYERAAQEHHKARYRLMEIEEIHKVTETVIASD